MDMCTEERAADVLTLVDCFEAIGAESHPDDYVVALSMAVAAAIGRRFSPQDWQERADRISHLIVTDLLCQHKTELAQ